MILRALVEVLVLLYAREASADAGEAVRVGDYCEPENSDAAACLWTADCPVGGCANKCIVNERLTYSWFTMFDRSAGEDSFQACPLLAFWLNRIIDISRSSSARRLMSTGGLQDIIRSGSRRSRDSVDAAFRRMHGGAGDINNAAGGAAGAVDPLRRLLDLEADAPSPGSSGLPSNRCPTPDDIDESATIMRLIASKWRDVFTIEAQGEEIPADLEDYAWVTEEPNTYQFLLTMFEDPDRVVEYLSNNCAEGVVQGLEVPNLFIYYLNEDQIELLEFPYLKIVQCLDNFGAVDELVRNFASLLLTCQPPFGLTPSCFSPTSFYMVSSTACAKAYGRMWNVSDVTALANVAAIAENINDACSEVTTEDFCLAAKAPDDFGKIDDLHDSFPVRNKIDIGEDIAVEPTDAASCLDFLDPSSCDTPAPAPADAPKMDALIPQPAPSPSALVGIAPLMDNPPVTDIGTASDPGSCALAAAAAAAAAGTLAVFLAGQ